MRCVSSEWTTRSSIRAGVATSADVWAVRDETPARALGVGMTPLSIPERLVQRLDDLGTELARCGDAIALIGLGSVGVDLDRLDDHSDLDFFVIVEDEARQGYL